MIYEQSVITARTALSVVSVLTSGGTLRENGACWCFSSWLQVLAREQQRFDQGEVTAFVESRARNEPLLVNTLCSRLDVAKCFNLPAFVDVICQCHINQSDISPNLFDLFKKPIKNWNRVGKGKEKRGKIKTLFLTG